jgi:hypothetical protein
MIKALENLINTFDVPNSYDKVMEKVALSNSTPSRIRITIPEAAENNITINESDFKSNQVKKRLKKIIIY